jgi:hypothetical protein
MASVIFVAAVVVFFYVAGRRALRSDCRTFTDKHR